MTTPKQFPCKQARCCLLRVAKCLFDLASGETLIARLKPQENGGEIIFARAVWVAVVVTLLSEALAGIARLIRLACEPFPVFPPVPLTAAGCVLGLLAWLRSLTETNGSFFLTVFAGCYAAFYARFASQWTYLADLYNQINAKEIDIAGAPHCQALTDRDSALAAIDAGATSGLQFNQAYLLGQWKCGFIEDAFTIHLAKKKLFASVIVNWAKDDVTRKLLQKKNSCFAKEALKVAASCTEAA